MLCTYYQTDGVCKVVRSISLSMRASQHRDVAHISVVLDETEILKVDTPMNNTMNKSLLSRARHNHVRNATPFGDPHIETSLISGHVDAGTDYRHI